MVLQCLTLIPKLWIQLINSIVHKECSTRHLPDSIIFDILIRLPPESVMRCRKVCRQWYAVASSPYFVNMHPQKTTSCLLVQITIRYGPRLDKLALHIFHEETRKFKKMRAGWIVIKEENMAPELVGCHHTKLVFQSWFQTERYYLCDLVTREKIIIKPPELSIFIGIFFHSVAREYRMLFRSKVRTKTDQYEILIYGCGSKTWRAICALSYMPHIDPYLVELNGNLHWLDRFSYVNMTINAVCRHSIFIFSVDTERFSVRPHPGREHCQWLSEHRNTYLLEMEGSLTFSKVGDSCIRIWVLEDYVTWSWTLRYKVHLNWDSRRFPFTSCSTLAVTSSTIFIELWNINNGELMIAWPFRGLFQYNLENKTLKKLDFEVDGLCRRGFLISLDLSRFQ